MSYTATYTNYWKPTLSEHDTEYIKAMGLYGSTIKGNPYRTHLKKRGEWAAICGQETGAGGRQKQMIDRRGWKVFKDIEGPGRPLCEKCLKALEAAHNIGVEK